MTYYDIHTHRLPANADVIAIISGGINIDFQPNVYYSAGIHPWYADKEALPSLRSYAGHPGVVAIGEVGLDKLAATPWALQKEVFAAQALLAVELKKPLIIHCVKAWDELIAIRKTCSPDSDIPWIIHGFRGNSELAGQLLRQDFFLSFGLLFQPDAARAAYKAHRLFAETDEKDILINTVFAALSSAISVSEADLSHEILENLCAWPHRFV
ncbi:MAG: TatD family hydrolase [Tannerella sp.]|jgi:TatD DNase family protein|nr:TatD family hydrolase [Tannerella sp.]